VQFEVSETQKVRNGKQLEFDKLMKRLSAMNLEYEDSMRQRDILNSNLAA
jgi:hypothetical protein